MGLGRVAALAVTLFVAGTAAADAAPRLTIDAVVDADDDDDDGVPDDLQKALGAAALGDLAPLAPLAPARRALAIRKTTGEGRVRLLADGEALAEGAAAPRRARRVDLQGTRAGRALVDLGGVEVLARVLGVTVLDAAGHAVDLATSHASLARTPPSAWDPAAPPSADPDALRWLVVGDREDLPRDAAMIAWSAAGARLDAIGRLPLEDVPCPDGTPADLACRATAPVRAVADEVDRDHPLARARSILAEVGGRLELVAAGRRLQAIRVGGPRETPVGAIPRLRARLRVSVVRERAGGPPPFGADDAAATALARRQVALASALWGQCGISFGPEAEREVRVVDPPPPHMVTLGCDLGLPASGGELRMRVDGHEVRVPLVRGAPPARAAHALAAAIEAAGLVARISENVRIDPAADASVDVLVRRKDGRPASIEAPRDGRISTDATLTACLGEVDLSDGLDHFTDVDAPAGTVEERALVKGLDDGDPGTIDVLLVSAFSGGGRIGESFIFSDRSSVRNVVIEDRGGVRADRASFALAHELGHVLLDLPGHPDDFGLDQPTRLMDADAADPSAFGPRRISIDECARVVRQSGPDAPVPLLQPWPLFGPGSRPAPAPPRRRPRPPIAAR